MEKCQGCPLIEADRPCLAQLTRHARYCRPEYRAVVAAYENPCADSADETERNREAIKKTMGLIARMKECPSWEKSSDCGCGNNRCRLGKGRDGIVSHQDCFECLREADSLTEAPRQSPGDCEN